MASWRGSPQEMSLSVVGLVQPDQAVLSLCMASWRGSPQEMSLSVVSSTLGASARVALLPGLHPALAEQPSGQLQGGMDPQA